MKKSILQKITTILIIVLLSIVGCEKEDPNLTPLERLPPKTQIGANTAGCLVNGEAVYAKNRFNLFYQNQKDLGVSFRLGDSELRKSINIASLNETLEIGNTYILSKVENDSKWGEYTEVVPFVSEQLYQTNSSITGELIITHHDYDNATISGTFWFDAVDRNGNTIEVREGRFDGQY